MKKLGALKTEILEAIRGKNDSEMAARVASLLREEHVRICRSLSWADLRSSAAYDMTGATSAGTILPANVCGIDRVRDVDNEYEFADRDREDVDQNDTGYRYYLINAANAPLVSGDDLAIGSKASSFTSSAVAAAIAGGTTVLSEYITFGSDPGLYKITSETSPFGITPAYRGAQLSSQGFEIRPSGTKAIVCVDGTGEIYTGGTVTVYFWALPEPLVDDQQIVLPDCVTDWLTLKVYRKIPEAKRFRPVSERELEFARADAIKLNASYGSLKPKGRTGSMFKFDTCPFTSRV